MIKMDLFPEGNGDSVLDLRAVTGVDSKPRVKNLRQLMVKGSTWLRCFTMTLLRQKKTDEMNVIMIPA